MGICPESGTLRVSTNKCQMHVYIIKISIITFVAVIHVVQGSVDCSHASPLNSTTGIINSTTYGYKTCQEWFIRGIGDEVIIISIQIMNIGNRGSRGTCEVDSARDNFLIIGPVPNATYCSSLINNTPKVYTSGRNHVWIQFVANEPGYRFSLHYVKEKREPDECQDNWFKCTSTKLCIPGTWRCNGADECGDNSDESHCTITSTTSTTPDPYDCGPKMFMCINRVTHRGECHSTVIKCDNKIDCQGGEDERNCQQATGGQCPHRYDETGFSGYLTSHNYPSPYTPGSSCAFYIQVKQMERIQLQFQSFDLGANDSVKIFDGTGQTSPLIGVFNMSHRPQSQIIESTHDTLFIMFVSSVPNGLFRGHRPKGFNATFQNKGHCRKDQVPCGHGELHCYDLDNRCDSIWHCPLHGGDERDCVGNCPGVDNFMCDKHSSQCYPAKERCDGMAHCSNKRDEEDCTAILCGSHNGTFLCDNNRCVREQWRCDGTNDCLDYSDEQGCSQPSTKVITAAVIGSLICGLLLVVALGCTCKLYALRLQEHQRILQQSTPISHIQESIYARRMAPPPYLEAMATSRPFDEMQREALQNQGQSGGRRSRRGRRRSRQGSHDTGERSVAVQPDSARDDEDVALIDVTVDETNRRSDSPLLIPPNDSSSEDEDDLDCNPIERSNVSISMAAGISAQWRRNPHKIDRSSSQHSTSDLDNPQNHADVASLDSASASNDSVVIALNDESPKVSNADISQTDQSISSATTNEGQTNYSYEAEGLYSANEHQGSDGEDSIVSAEVQDDSQPLIAS